ncbi:polysaccharide deacetylase family protein [Jatrophihabitans endophyticus]|uniref:polysaccharide deacetylase family protein n=1 Tax=Jatrophihabitans endophyticus TaxID=1206085 RepID=UPI0013564C34|nr:polysaccharide deacetylase [Jatrophihabitans endophyticus]
MTAYAWPADARAALCVTFDLDAESPYIWRTRADPPADVAELEQRRYGPRRGVEHLLAVLDRTATPATFFVPGWVATQHRNAVRDVVAAGHELALHGWCHEPPDQLTPDELRATLRRARDVIGDLAGRAPRGYRSPSWRMTPTALDVLAELGLAYDSSLMGDDRPYDVGGLVEIPVDWTTDDAVHYRYTGHGERAPVAPQLVVDSWRDELAGARDHGALVMLTMHPWISGRPARAHRLEQLLHEAHGLDDLWIGTAGALADHHTDLPHSAQRTRVARDEIGRPDDDR